MEWKTMDSAPRDGSPFLVQYLPYGNACLCMRRVQFSVNRDGERVTRDLGSWLRVHGIEDDLENGSPTIPSPQWSIAPDGLNSVGAWRWAPMPCAPESIKGEIKQALAA